MHDCPDAPELWQDVVVEVDEMLAQLLLAVLQAGVHVVVVPFGLLHPESEEHGADQEGGAAAGKVVPSGASVPESTGSSLEEEGAVCHVPLRPKVFHWSFRVHPWAPIF